MLEACSSGGDESPANSGGNNNNGGNNNTSGYSVSGSTVSITLSNSNFVKLQNDGWMNFTAQNMLLLKIDASTYRAFTNACPHQGTRTMWSYNTSDDTFKCGNHQGVYPTDCTTNGSNGGPLKCYTTSLKDGILSVTK
jgi:nitrite reductase/ring-hydroxylating ferredoxin subunit